VSLGLTQPQKLTQGVRIVPHLYSILALSLADVKLGFFQYFLTLVGICPTCSVYSVKFAINLNMVHRSAITSWKRTMSLLFLHLFYLHLLRPKLLQLKLFSGHLRFWPYSKYKKFSQFSMWYPHLRMDMLNLFNPSTYIQSTIPSSTSVSG